MNRAFSSMPWSLLHVSPVFLTAEFQEDREVRTRKQKLDGELYSSVFLGMWKNIYRHIEDKCVYVFIVICYGLNL